MSQQMNNCFIRLGTIGVLLLLAVIAVVWQSCSNKRSGKPRILVFSKTAAFYHKSIPAGSGALIKMGKENGFDVDTTTDASVFNDDGLAQYSAIVFLSTTGDVLNQYQEVAFERYIQAGGGFVGIHAASDTEYDWRWYGRLVGAYFQNHPRPQRALFRVVDHSHPATETLPDTFSYHDEWYNFKWISPDINALITIDEQSYEGGNHGDHHPMAWYQEFDGGRSFFTGFGHSDESFQDSLHLQHILGGIQYAIGENTKLNYSKATSQPVPERRRFVKTPLLDGGLLFEPTEMAILPNLDILVAQRRGELLLYNQATSELRQVARLPVYYRTEVPNVNAEEGLLGMALDPDFGKNNFLYLFYSPLDTSVNRLSRFEYNDGKLNLASEKIILQFYSQRDICCHTGGSIAFGGDGLLYLSTGDNSTPFNQPDPSPYKNQGFSPTDGRLGFEQYDARRSSGNTNDLRGKILRIKVLADGSYDIPEGNLFAGQEKTRPEIYVMGNRNPYRISVDPKTNFLYWGEIGPDANEDMMHTRGPRGYDEINQARNAGFFGWPFFIGANFPYRSFDYQTGESGELFDPERPENTSPNNTGLNVLPPAQPAFIWYPYAASPDFPQVGTGGRNAMAGPVYYVNRFPKTTRYPDYYDGKLFIYDWVRGWIKAVTMQPGGDFDRLEPFMEGETFASPIDMEVGPDGKLYILEYGRGWYSKNSDAGIARIDYFSGNLPPTIDSVIVDRSNGNLPLTVEAIVAATDFENDKLSYQWQINDEVVKTDQPVITYTLKEAGDHRISVVVLDSKGGRTASAPVMVYAGNEVPIIDIVISDAKPTYLIGDAVDYEVKINDRGRPVNLDNLVIAVNYLQGQDLAGTSMGHQRASQVIEGRSLMMASDCQSCHQLDAPSIGPSFMQVATRYGGKRDSPSYLAEKILQGGSGVWGEVAMAAHPGMTEADAARIVQWILSLSNPRSGNHQKSLPAKGTIIAKPPFGDAGEAVMQITAQYTNSPGAGMRPLTGTKTIDVKLVK